VVEVGHIGPEFEEGLDQFIVTYGHYGFFKCFFVRVAHLDATLMRKLVLTIGFAHFWVIGRVEPVVRHIVEDLETDYKSVIV